MLVAFSVFQFEKNGIFFNPLSQPHGEIKKNTFPYFCERDAKESSMG